MDTVVNTRRRVYQGRVFELFRENLTLENGRTVDLDVIRHPGAAAVVAFGANDTVVLVHQFRHAAGGRIWEIPAGTLEPGEPALACGQRELAEEAGVTAGSWVPLTRIIPVPGYSDERIQLFAAYDLKPANQSLDGDEVMDVHHLPIAQVWRMIDSGDIHDAKTLCGLFLALRHHAGAGDVHDHRHDPHHLYNHDHTHP
jgi:ADP-ribose pyrophosphatase